jgi:ELWxxDGT repeat protein
LLSGSVVGTAPVVNLGSASVPASTTPPAASLVQDLVPGQNGSFPQNFVAASGTLFFLAFDQNNFFDKLWASDGTGPGTHEVASNLEANPPVALGASGSVAFTAFNLSPRGFGIWVSDGTTAGTYQAGALPSSSTDAVGVVGATAFFELFDFQTRREELWKSDGTTSGTGFVTAIAFTTGFTASGNKLFFVANDGTHGEELWASDGTAAGTGMVADIDPGPGSSNPFDLTDVGGTLYFLAQSSPGAADQLWTSDGTAAGTHVVAPALAPDQLAADGGDVVFTGVDDAGNYGLWSSDGTTAGTHQIASLPNGSASGLVLAANTVFFGFYPDVSETGDIEIWTSDGTASGTAPIATLTDASKLTAVGNRVYFTVDDPVLGNELFTSDGTAAGTAIVADINPGPNGSFPRNLTAAGNTLYFDADDGTHGDELWEAVAPASVPTSPSPAPTPINEGSVFTATSSFTDSNADGPWTATVNYGDGSGDQPLALNPDMTFALQHHYLDNGSYTITVTVTGSSSVPGTGSETVSVLNVPPTATLTAPATSPEGTAITPSAVINDQSPVDVAAGFTEAWSVTKNGAAYATGAGAGFSFTPDDNGTYAVTLTATDKDGGVSAPASATITVFDVAPTVTLTAPATSPEGTAITPSALITDPSPVDVAAGFTEAWSVTKNGAPYATGSGAGFSFTPDDNGTYVVTLTATDKDGGASAPTSATITVFDVAPTVKLTAAATSPEGTAITPAAVITDPSPVDVAAGFTEAWSVTMNGAPYATGAGAGFSFTPDDNGTYVVTLSAADKDGLASSASTTIVVTNVPPAVQLSGDSSGVRGQVRALGVTVTDPSTVDTAAGFSVTINWGDGSPVQSVVTNQSAGANHVFTQAGTYAVVVTATDKDGGATTATWSIKVSAVALEPDPNNPALTDLVVGGTTGADTILFLSGSAPGSVQVNLNGSALGSFKPTGRIIAFGQAGNDQIAVSSSITLPSELHGGAGDDLLVGGGGDNILVGGTGDDILIGSGKHNVLIGGLGSDLLIGSGDDLMVAGATAYDDNSLALGAILAEWEQPLSLASRVGNLTSGISAGGQTIALNAATIINDLAVDILMDLGSDAWSVVSRGDLVLDACRTVVVTTVA